MLPKAAKLLLLITSRSQDCLTVKDDKYTVKTLVKYYKS